MVLKSRILPFLFLPVVFIWIHIQSATAQSQEKIYSVYMLNFVKGIEWPGATSTKFVIGVLSYPPLSTELKQAFSTAKIKNHSVEIREYNSIADIEACQMLFIPAFKSRSFEDALTKIGTKSTLIISNKLGMAQKGAGVNFILVDGKPKYEINCKTIEKRGMKISSAVKGMGILIE